MTKKRLLHGNAKWARLLVMILLAIPFATPLYIALINVFKDSNTIVAKPLSLPIPLHFENLIYALTAPDVGVPNMYKNSVILAVCGLALTLLVSVPAAYYLARSNTRLSRFLRTYFLIGIMVPYVIVYIPLCMFLRKVGIEFNLATLIFVFVSGNISFATFMYTKFMQSVPIELEEAALIDGASRIQILTKVIFPLLKPCTATVVIFVFLNIWNDFMTPLLLGQIKTITVGIYTVIGPHSADWGIVFSYVFLASIPMVILFLCFQDQFISGLTKGATKG